MALIKCQECGKEVSSLANCCPNCGAPIHESKKIKVHFWRKKKFTGSAITGSIFIDGNRVATGDNGTSVDIMVAPGNHIFSTETSVNNYGTSGRGNSVSVNVGEDVTSIDVEIVLKSHLGMGYIAIGNVKSV